MLIEPSTVLEVLRERFSGEEITTLVGQLNQEGYPTRMYDLQQVGHTNTCKALLQDVLWHGWQWFVLLCELVEAERPSSLGSTEEIRRLIWWIDPHYLFKRLDFFFTHNNLNTLCFIMADILEENEIDKYGGEEGKKKAFARIFKALLLVGPAFTGYKQMILTILHIRPDLEEILPTRYQLEQ